MRQKNKFWLLVAACIPGCGQMYQGYMRRGVSLLTAACAVIAVVGFMPLFNFVLMALPVLWLFSFFDTYNIQNRPEGDERPDEFLFGLDGLQEERMTQFYAKRHHVVGWVLVGAGAYALYRMVMNRLMALLPYGDGGILGWLHGLLVYDVPKIVVTLLVIGLGLWFIRGPRRREEPFQPFAPSAPAETGTGGEDAADAERDPDAGEDAADAERDSDAKEKTADAERDPDAGEDAAGTEKIPDGGAETTKKEARHEADGE